MKLTFFLSSHKSNIKTVHLCSLCTTLFMHPGVMGFLICVLLPCKAPLWQKTTYLVYSGKIIMFLYNGTGFTIWDWKQGGKQMTYVLFIDWEWKAKTIYATHGHGRIQDFGQGGQRSFDARGALSSKFAQNCLKTAWLWETSWGQGGGGSLDPPVQRLSCTMRFGFHEATS